MSSRARPDPASPPGLRLAPDPSESVGVSEVLAALSFALDLTEGQPFGHSLRSCLIGMSLAGKIGLPLQERRDLYYALLLKDVGCSSNAARIHELFGGDDRLAKRDLKTVNWSRSLEAAHYALAHVAPGRSWLERMRRVARLAGSGPKAARELVQARCARGAQIVKDLGFGPTVSEAVGAIDEHWDGRGEPRGLRRGEIPLLGRILGLAQTLEVFSVIESPAAAVSMAKTRRGSWFDPTLVEAAIAIEPELTKWAALDDRGLQDAVRAGEPGDAVLLAGAGALDRIAVAFAAVVDAKSPFTADHSRRVTDLAVRVAEALGIPAEERTQLRRAALLHDLGKLSVPNSVLDKPGPLSAQEWETVRLHPHYTQRILERVRGFQSLAFVASSHHERLDGRGYFRGLSGDQVPLGARILMVADIYDALTSERPYRPAMTPEVALGMIEQDRGTGVAEDCYEALVKVVEEVERPAA